MPSLTAVGMCAPYITALIFTFNSAGESPSAAPGKRIVPLPCAFSGSTRDGANLPASSRSSIGGDPAGIVPLILRYARTSTTGSRILIPDSDSNFFFAASRFAFAAAFAAASSVADVAAGSAAAASASASPSSAGVQYIPSAGVAAASALESESASDADAPGASAADSSDGASSVDAVPGVYDIPHSTFAVISSFVPGLLTPKSASTNPRMYPLWCNSAMGVPSGDPPSACHVTRTSLILSAPPRTSNDEIVTFASVRTGASAWQ